MRRLLLFSLIALVGTSLVACGEMFNSNNNPKSSSGVTKASAKISTGTDGLTTEQRNIRDRLEMDNKLGSIKHLYVFNQSGGTIFYSTVRGKVTSSGKRLTPTSVAAIDGQQVSSSFNGFSVDIGGRTYKTSEVLQDDGTYGSSSEYLYWWDVNGQYRQLYIPDTMLVLVSDFPISVSQVTIDLRAVSMTSDEFETGG